MESNHGEPIRSEFLGDAPVKGSIDVIYDDAWLAYQEGQHADALAGLGRVLAVVPDYERAHFAKGLAHLGLGQAAEAERALSGYLRMVAYKQLNTCDALYFRAMASSRLGLDQKALVDLDGAASGKPGCLAGCACGMSYRRRVYRPPAFNVTRVVLPAIAARHNLLLLN